MMLRLRRTLQGSGFYWAGVRMANKNDIEYIRHRSSSGILFPLRRLSFEKT